MYIEGPCKNMSGDRILYKSKQNKLELFAVSGISSFVLNTFENPRRKHGFQTLNPRIWQRVCCILVRPIFLSVCSRFAVAYNYRSGTMDCVLSSSPLLLPLNL